jgi:hypothetical protein
VVPGSGSDVRIVDPATALDGARPRLLKVNAEQAEYEIIPALFEQKIFPEFIVLMTHKGLAGLLLGLLRANHYEVTDAGRGARFHCRRWFPAIPPSPAARS